MGQKAKSVLAGLFYLVFGVLFTSLVLRMAGSNAAVNLLVPRIGIMLVLLLWAYRFLGKHEGWLEKRYPILLGAFLALFGVVQMATAVQLRFEPIYDLQAIYEGAIEWVETGSFPSYYDYFYTFPNNLGGMGFLAVFFSLAKLLGIADYYMVACVANCLCCLLTMLLTVTICKKLLGVKYAVFAMVLFVVSLPFYFMAAVFYTDSLSMLFPVLGYYLYLKVQESEILWKKLVFAGLLGGAIMVGMLVKVTVLIMLIAILIDSLLHRSWKQTGILAGISLLVVCIGYFSYQNLIYASHLDREEAHQKNTPYIHWIMMGLKGYGMYNPDDYNFTWSISDPEEREAAIKEEIGKRIEEYGPGGLYKLFWMKSGIIFGSGTYNQSDFLDDNPVNEGTLHRYLLYAGEDYETYKNTCQGVFLAIQFLMALSGLQEVFGRKTERGEENKTNCGALRLCRRTGRKSGSRVTQPDLAQDQAPVPEHQKGTSRYLAPRLAVFGALLFFACWETSGRYITNYIPVIFLSAVMGIDCWVALAQRAKEALRLDCR